MPDIDALINKGFYPIGDRPEPGPKTIVVVGVARGGTSIVAGTLAKLGIFMGDKACAPVFEDVRLASAIEASDLQTVFDTIASYNDRASVWGFKRPSVVEKLEPLHPLLRNPVYLFIFRDVMVISNRSAISMKKAVVPAMRRAHDAVGNILTFIERAPVSGVLLSTEKVLLRKDEFVDRLIDYLGLESVVTRAERQRAKDFITIDPVDYLDRSRLEFIGHVGPATPSFVAGWAWVRNSPKPAKLQISVNGLLAGSTTADRPRPDVKARGFHQTGKCGFHFVYPEGLSLKAGDEVAVQFVRGSEHLKGSPKLVEPAAADSGTPSE